MLKLDSIWQSFSMQGGAAYISTLHRLSQAETSTPKIQNNTIFQT